MARIFFLTAVSNSFSLQNTRRGISQAANYQAYWISPKQAIVGERLILAASGLPTHNGGCRAPGGRRDLMRAEKLSDADVEKNLQTVKGWSLVNGKLHKQFECKDFVTAFGKMTQVALVAEWMNHHPEWFNVWNKVVIDLNTHSVQGISNLDFQLAEKINEIFGN
jgi:4a-hydroxytetrahydrobiopterin dehydratase